MKIVDYHNNVLYIKFGVPRSEFYFILKQIKLLQGARFDAISQQWIALSNKSNIDQLFELGFIPTQTVKDMWKKTPQFIIPKTPRKEINLDLLSRNLRKYQLRGIEFLEAVNGNGIIGDAPRLGKSAQALGYCLLHPEFKRILIVCPSNVKIGWQREIKKWVYTDAHIIYGKTIYPLVREKYIIINYDIFYAWKEELKTYNFDVIIVDELHYLGNKIQYNAKAGIKIPVKRTRAFEELSNKIKHVILLSGTPIKAAPIQFFTVLHAIAPTVFSNEWYYKQHFCGPRATQYGMDYSGASNSEELVAKIAPFMIRRRKEDVFIELPLKQRIIVNFDKDNSEKREQELHEKILWIEDFLKSGEKLIVFAWHREICEKIHDYFKEKSILIYGGIDSREREKRRISFQTNNKKQLLVGQVLSINVGIDLSAADVVAFVEFPYNPGDLEQAEERVFMPGDGKQRITIYYLVGKDSPEERIAEILETKNQIVSRIVDNKYADRIF